MPTTSVVSCFRETLTHISLFIRLTRTILHDFRPLSLHIPTIQNLRVTSFELVVTEIFVIYESKREKERIFSTRIAVKAMQRSVFLTIKNYIFTADSTKKSLLQCQDSRQDISVRFSLSQFISLSYLYILFNYDHTQIFKQQN